MLCDQPILRIEKERGAIERRASALDNADDQTGVRLGGEFGQSHGFRPAGINRISEVVREPIAPFREAIAKPRAEYLSLWITAEQCFRHDDKPCPSRLNLAGKGEYIRERFRFPRWSAPDLQRCDCRCPHSDPRGQMWRSVPVFGNRRIERLYGFRAK